MTDKQRALFFAVEEVLQQHVQTFDDLCETYAQAFDDDAAQADHPLVKSALRDASAGLRGAGMDWYVSTK